MKRAIIMMDMSGLGRCAMTVALPVLSAMDVQAVPLVTMLLSAHTGGFGEVEKCDLTDFARGAVAHYDRLGAKFDAVYAGYLANDAQAEILAQLIAQQRDALVLIDPVMADHGKYYSGIGPGRADAYRGLIAHADVVTPNLTEAQLLTGLGDGAPPEALLRGLLGLGCGAAVIKGVMKDGRAANAYQARGEAVFVPYEPAPGAYPGTGDLFASVMLGSMLRGEDAVSAVGRAAGFVRGAVIKTNEAGTASREGVRFEGMLGGLMR